jgi:hypothetical protein
MDFRERRCKNVGSIELIKSRIQGSSDWVCEICLSVYGCTVLFFDSGRFCGFLIIYTVGRTSWTGDQPVARPLPTHRTSQTQNKRTLTSMLRVGFEPTIPVFERAKTVHALDHAATLIGVCINLLQGKLDLFVSRSVLLVRWAWMYTRDAPDG